MSDAQFIVLAVHALALALSLGFILALFFWRKK